MFGHDIQASIGPPMEVRIIGAWVLVSLVAFVVTAFGWWRRRTLDLKWDASLLITGCVAGCLLWCALQARGRGTPLRESRRGHTAPAERP